MRLESGSAAPLAPGLYLVATPLGNLGDLSQRAREVLSRASFIAGESSKAVLRWLEILSGDLPAQWSRPGVMSYRESTRERDTERIVDKLERGETVALISDAGTPGVSDPGWFVVRKARELGLAVWPIPGACAAVAALSVCPFPTRFFRFEGFVANSGKQRREALARVAGCEEPVILYESPHRVLQTLADLAQLCPQRELFVIREMTKHFEESWWGGCSDAVQAWESKIIKGEFTLVLGPVEQDKERNPELPTATVDFLRELKLPAKTTTAIARHFYPDIPKRDLYKLFSGE